MFRAWEIRKVADSNPLPTRKLIPEIYFRHVERIMLYLAKHIIQSIVLLTVKGYFILSTRTKRWLGLNWPKVYNLFRKNPPVNPEPQQTTFFQKAVRESKAKIRKIKENVKKDQAEKEIKAEEEKAIEEAKSEEQV